MTFSTAGVTTIFMGHREDLVAQYQDSLTGKADKEPWYKVELPDALMPGTKGKVTHDLAKTPKIDVTIHFSLQHPTESIWTTLSTTSTDGKITGRLELTGRDALDASRSEGADLGLYSECEVIDDVKFPTFVAEHFRATFVLGALASTRPGSEKGGAP